MKMHNTCKTMRGISLMFVAGAAWLAGSFVMPTDSLAGSCSRGSSASSNGSYNSNAANMAVLTDFSSATLVCVSRSTVLDTMGYDQGHGNVARNVQVCHVPQGAPEARHTIIVDQSAVSALLAQGDSLGMCPNWVSESYLEDLPGCSTIDAGGHAVVVGVWMPNSAQGDGASLNAYFTQVQAGSLSGRPASASYAYREIYGQ